MSRLVRSQISKHKEKKFICDGCIKAFGSQELLKKHEEYCSKHNVVNTIFPTPGVNDVLRFKNVQNQVKCPIKIYADFESLLIPIDDTSGHTK